MSTAGFTILLGLTSFESNPATTITNFAQLGTEHIGFSSDALRPLRTEGQGEITLSLRLGPIFVSQGA